MDIEIYEVPGTGHYVCTSHAADASWVERFAGRDVNYDLFTSLNDELDYANDDLGTAGIALYTASDREAGFSGLVDDLQDLERGLGNELKVTGGLAAWCCYLMATNPSPVGIPITALSSIYALNTHTALSEVREFAGRLRDGEVSADDALTELRGLYDERGVDRTRSELDGVRGELGLFRRLFPGKGTAERIEGLEQELAASYTALKDRAHELAEELDAPSLRQVGDVYGKLATGATVPLVSARKG